MSDKWIPVDGNYSDDEPAVDGSMCWVSVVAKGTVEVKYVVLGFLDTDWPIGSDHEVHTWRYWVGEHNPIEKKDVKVVAYMPAEVPEPYIPEKGKTRCDLANEYEFAKFKKYIRPIRNDQSFWFMVSKNKDGYINFEVFPQDTKGMFTDEELKAELYNRGYYVTKKPYRPKRDACVCGRKIVDLCSDWSGGPGEYRKLFFRCPKCGLRSESAKTRSGAVDKWNELVRRRKEIKLQAISD